MLDSARSSLYALPSMGEQQPALIWGLVSRGVGLTYLIAFCSLAPQLLPIAGRAGLLPIEEALRAHTRDFPGWRRFFYFPTLLWLSASDRSLRLLLYGGIAAAAASVIGGTHAPYACGLCWLTYLSFDRALTLIYPWDSLLLEGAPELGAHVAAFWSELVPQLRAAPQASFAGLRAHVETLRVRFGRPLLCAFERIGARYAALLFARLEPKLRAAGIRSFFASSVAYGVDSSYELRLLTQYVVSRGRATYDDVIAQPEHARQHAAHMNLFSGHCFQAVFRYEWLVYESQKLRLLNAMNQVAGRPQPTARQRAAKTRNDLLATHAFGVIALASLLLTQFTSDEDVLDIPERWPSFAFDAHAEVKRIP